MATISRTGITTGGTISPTHITNIIDALDGTSASTTVIASGSFSGSLTGRATNATSASYATTSSYATQALSASFASTASYVANASSFPYSGSARITGSLDVTGSLSVSGSVTIKGTTTTTNLAMTGSLSGVAVADNTHVLNLSNIGSATKGTVVLPIFQPSTDKQIGSVYWNNDIATLYVWDGANWRSSIFV
jgi:hypothetical protein